MIVFFLPNGIGDTLMAIPALRRLAAIHGTGNITVVISSSFHRTILVAFLGEALHTIERYDGRPLPHLRLFLRLLFTRIDVLYAPLLSRKPGHLPFFLFLGKRTLVPSSFLGRNFCRLVRSDTSLETSTGHQVNYFVQFLAQLEPRLNRAPVAPEELAPVPAASVPAAGLGAGRPCRVALGISCGPLERHKIPSAKGFASLVNALAGRAEFEWVVIGTAADQALIDEFAEGLAAPDRVRRMIDLPIGDLVEQLRSCDLGISGTTGQGHMMAAAGIPMLVLAGVTEPFESGPYTRRGAILRHRLPCGPCYQGIFRFGCQKIPCMETLDVEAGADLAIRLLTDPRFGQDWLVKTPKQSPVAPETIAQIHEKMKKLADER